MQGINRGQCRLYVHVKDGDNNTVPDLLGDIFEIAPITPKIKELSHIHATDIRKEPEKNAHYIPEQIRDDVVERLVAIIIDNIDRVFGRIIKEEMRREQKSCGNLSQNIKI